MTTRGLAIVAGVALSVGVIVVAYLLGAHTRPAAASGVTAPVGAPLSVPLRPPEDPVAVAIGWLRAYRGLRWSDPAPSSWVDRVRPYVGPELAAEYEQARAGSAGTTWASFVHDQCITTVRDGGGVIPPEAPRAPESVYVQVSGTVVTQCTAGAPPRPAEPVAATVEFRRSVEGSWVVSRRLF
jgi:hypothetical protein